MSPFERLLEIASAAFPYWLIFAIFISVLGGIVAKRSNQGSFLPSTIGQFGATCASLFMVLGVYIQLTGSAMSFVQLLPSSLLVAAGFSVTSLAWMRSKEDIGLGMCIVAIAFFTVALGTSLAFFVSFFPKLIGFQWHLLKRF